MKHRPAQLGLLQPSLPGLDRPAAVLEDERQVTEDERGAIFTRREVVDFILDLAGYTINKPLHRIRFLEPSSGNGDFLLPAVQRLLQAWGGATGPRDLRGSVRAVELHEATYDATRAKISELLQHFGLTSAVATDLADHWLIRGDFLLVPLPPGFDVVAGNPPYVRQELIPDRLLAEYRARFSTIYDRADLYVPFIERSLRLLAANGQLGFICADRWMKNRYGGPLRKLVAEGYHLKYFVDMVETAAFHSEVTAYPAVTVISRQPPGVTRVSHQPSPKAETLQSLATELLSPRAPGLGANVRDIPSVVRGSEPWVFDVPAQLKLVRRLEREFPGLEEAGCKVGIGVATGADRAFIGPFEDLRVEFDRKLPLVMTRDLVDGEVHWRGLGVVNPFAADGSLVDLAEYPLLRAYLEERKKKIAGRHVARRIPANWYRTIDRIDPNLVHTPKLLIPDIKGEAHIVYEHGRLYPHHNLYFITSNIWDLRALQAVLRSGIARLFVSAYSTRMRGGYLRFQAQYLRRIRIPHWEKVSSAHRRKLIEAARRNDPAACNVAAAALYGLTPEEQSVLCSAGS